ncbi:hypothetical protein ACJX0J_028278 [Zea mays]
MHMMHTFLLSCTLGSFSVFALHVIKKRMTDLTNQIRLRKCTNYIVSAFEYMTDVDAAQGEFDRPLAEKMALSNFVGVAHAKALDGQGRILHYSIDNLPKNYS